MTDDSDKDFMYLIATDPWGNELFKFKASEFNLKQRENDYQLYANLFEVITAFKYYPPSMRKEKDGEK
jgi:hypothetical protein